MMAEKYPLTAAIGRLPSSVEGVLERLRSIQLVTGPMAPKADRQDGLADFNLLYTRITEQIFQRLPGGSSANQFSDPTFLATLDVQFANRYFSALINYESRSVSASRSWSEILDHRADRRIGASQFAMCGVNSHINFDLPFALLNTWHSLDQQVGYQGDPVVQRSDYQQVNDIFRAEMARLTADMSDDRELRLERTRLEGWLLGTSDRLVVLDRDAAWNAARALLRKDLATIDADERRLDKVSAKVNAILLRT